MKQQNNKAKEKAIEFLEYWENITKSTAVNKAKYEKAIDIALKEQAKEIRDWIKDELYNQRKHDENIVSLQNMLVNDILDKFNKRWLK